MHLAFGRVFAARSSAVDALYETDPWDNIVAFSSVQGYELCGEIPYDIIRKAFKQKGPSPIQQAFTGILGSICRFFRLGVGSANRKAREILTALGQNWQDDIHLCSVKAHRGLNQDYHKALDTTLVQKVKLFKHLGRVPLGYDAQASIQIESISGPRMSSSTYLGWTGSAIVAMWRMYILDYAFDLRNPLWENCTVLRHIQGLVGMTPERGYKPFPSCPHMKPAGTEYVYAPQQMYQSALVTWKCAEEAARLYDYEVARSSPPRHHLPTAKAEPRSYSPDGYTAPVRNTYRPPWPEAGSAASIASAPGPTAKMDGDIDSEHASWTQFVITERPRLTGVEGSSMVLNPLSGVVAEC